MYFDERNVGSDLLQRVLLEIHAAVHNLRCGSGGFCGRYSKVHRPVSKKRRSARGHNLVEEPRRYPGRLRFGVRVADNIRRQPELLQYFLDVPRKLVMNCKFSETTSDCKRVVFCLRPGCGRKLRNTPSPLESIHAECRSWPEWHEFGEWLRIFLAAFAITPEGVSWISWKLGLVEVPKKCGCEARKRWLNTLGGRLVTGNHWLAKWLVRRAKAS